MRTSIAAACLALALVLVACSSDGASFDDCKKATVTSDVASEAMANEICDGVRARGGSCQVCVQSTDSSGRASAWFVYQAPAGCPCAYAPR